MNVRQDDGGSVFRLWVAKDRPEWGAMSITAGTTSSIVTGGKRHPSNLKAPTGRNEVM